MGQSKPTGGRAVYLANRISFLDRGGVEGGN